MMSLSASAQPTDYHYNTAMTQVYGSQYPITGRLDVQVFPDGTLRGYYHTSFYKLYIPVTGGRDADYIWLDIGPSSVDLGLGAGPQGRLHVVATVSGDGSIRGQVYPESAAVLSGLSAQYGFGSSPPESAGNQYLFTALPSTTVDPTPSP
ncbi:MAG: hypothetical protein JOZ77_04045 [Candidatus Eremiobacteraeota bacterium]|nr:hypothetical protein [Candidatus Eremiobacteraeota bacterium]